MGGWRFVDTVRCERCSVFMPAYDVVLSADGTAWCTSCGPPAAPRRPKLLRSPLAVAAAICAGLFVAFVTLVELAT